MLPGLLIFPCNGNAIEALDCISDAYRLIGFVDDTPQKQAGTVAGHAVHPRSALRPLAGCEGARGARQPSVVPAAASA